MSRVAIASLVVACASSAPRDVPPPAPPPTKCAHVADHLLSLLSSTAREAPTEELDRVRAMFNMRCREDGWSIAAQDCFLSLRDKAEVDRCAAQLTDAQRAALEQPAVSGSSAR